MSKTTSNKLIVVLSIILATCCVLPLSTTLSSEYMVEYTNYGDPVSLTNTCSTELILNYDSAGSTLTLNGENVRIDQPGISLMLLTDSVYLRYHYSGMSVTESWFWFKEANDNIGFYYNFKTLTATINNNTVTICGYTADDAYFNMTKVFEWIAYPDSNGAYISKFLTSPDNVYTINIGNPSNLYYVSAENGSWIYSSEGHAVYNDVKYDVSFNYTSSATDYTSIVQLIRDSGWVAHKGSEEITVAPWMYVVPAKIVTEEHSQDRYDLAMAMLIIFLIPIFYLLITFTISKRKCFRKKIILHSED